MPLPNYITAIRTITYDTEQIRESLAEMVEDPDSISDDDIIGLIQDWADEDLNGDYRLLDEDGNELD